MLNLRFFSSSALKGGDATKGKFATMYDGPRPDCKKFHDMP